METLKKWISQSNNIVFFGGAGVSTASGIPDFRSVDGLYNQKFDYPPETILSHSFFVDRTVAFYEFYREKMLPLDVKPNVIHEKLALWEREGKLKAVVTQNIDGLHQKAGSRAVFPLHGSIYDNVCMECGRTCSLDTVLRSENVPRCQSCGGVIRPGITLYGEAPDPLVMRGACREIARSDLLIVAGTSLTVEPAASCLSYFHGKALVVINKDPLKIEREAALVIRGHVEEVLGEIRVPERPQRVLRNWWS